MVAMVRAHGDTLAYKRESEMSYWRRQFRREGVLDNSHYEWFYTTAFGLPSEFYEGKRVLDIGCGPRGSLEWAHMAAERVGLDPLVDRYRQLGIDQHAMEYVCAPSEAIPFEDGHFDVVTSFNSLDHVDDLLRTAAEIGRVTARGGSFLLFTDLHDQPTPEEPHTFSVDVLDLFRNAFEVAGFQHLEKVDAGNGYESARAAVPWNAQDPTPRYGLLIAMLVRR